MAAVTPTPDQRATMGGISSNVRTLIRCINHRYAKEQDRFLLALDDNDCDDNAPATGNIGRNDRLLQARLILQHPRARQYQLQEG